jgi:hypothetical protein
VGGSGAAAPGGEELSKMSARLTDRELIHLLEFVGYGTLDAGVWFLGMEEAGGGEDNLRKRLKQASWIAPRLTSSSASKNITGEERLPSAHGGACAISCSG